MVSLFSFPLYAAYSNNFPSGHLNVLYEIVDEGDGCNVKLKAYMELEFLHQTSFLPLWELVCYFDAIKYMWFSNL